MIADRTRSIIIRSSMTIHYPDDEEIVPRQLTYIRQFVNNFESRLFSSKYTDAEQGFERMLNTLFLGAFILFAVVIWQLMMSRDPIVGFALAGLFLMTLVFVAYPLFEALRLSFIENGKFSLSIWKTILQSEGYLSALWGSLKLGCWTATFSTIVGFNKYPSFDIEVNAFIC